MNIFNIQNSNENIKRNSKKINKNNKKESNYKNNPNDKNIATKSNELNNVLPELDSFQEIDSADESSPNINGKNKVKNNNFKLNNNDKAKRKLTKDFENSITYEHNNIKEINNVIYNKQKNNKGEIKENENNIDDSDEIIIIMMNLEI